MKRFVLIVLLITIGVVVGFLVNNKQPPVKKVAVPTVAPADQNGLLDKIPTPKIINAISLTVPKSVELFTINNSEINYQTIAGSLGFTGSPSVVNGSLGKSYIWASGKKTLVIDGSPPNIAFSNDFSSPSAIAKTKTGTLEQIANQAVSSIQGQSKKIQYRPTRTTPLQTNSSSDPSATIFYYKYYLNNIPLFFGSPSLAEASVMMSPKGDVLTIQTHLFSVIEDRGETVDLLSSEEIVNSFQTKAIFSRYIDQTSQKQEYKEVDIAPGSITTQTASFGYYLQKENLLPVVVVSGTGKTVDGKTIEATFFVPAYK